MKKRNENPWPSLIIVDGRPYLLKKLTRQGVNDPCSMCDLRNQCNRSHHAGNLSELCCSDDRGEDWYYEEDWTIVGKQIVEFVMDPMYLQMDADVQNVVKNETHKELEL